jgi:RNA polymerase sigma-70 factor (ECF subfamily)
VERCQQGDQSAFRELYDLYSGRILRHLVVLIGQTPEVEDALQMSFATAFRKIHTFDFRTRFSSWLHGIALGTARNALRSRRRRGRAMDNLTVETRHRDGEGRAGPDHKVALRQRAALLDDALADLSADRRVVFTLYYVEQLEVAEIAARLGVSESAAWGRIKRARAQVVQAVKRDERRGRGS